MRATVSSWVEPAKRFCFHLVVGVSAIVMFAANIYAATSQADTSSHHHHKHKAASSDGGDKKATVSHHKAHHKKSHKHAAVTAAAATGAVAQKSLSDSHAPDSHGAVAANNGGVVASQGQGSDVVVPEQEGDVSKGSETGLPLPRFASLRSDRVYMRRGPGERYPIDWVYYRRGLPIKIEREFGVWRLIEDSEGQKGWVHQVTLRGTRDFVVLGDTSSQEALPSKDVAGATPLKNDTAQSKPVTHADSQIVGYVSPQKLQGNFKHDALLMSSALANHVPVAVLEPGTVGMIKACPAASTLCHVTVRGYDGWLDRHALWGVQPGEIIQPD